MIFFNYANTHRIKPHKEKCPKCARTIEFYDRQILEDHKRDCTGEN